MKGSIRTLVGFLVALGAMGTLEIEPQASVILQTSIAAVGLFVMYSGVRVMKVAQ